MADGRQRNADSTTARSAAQSQKYCMWHANGHIAAPVRYAATYHAQWSCLARVLRYVKQRQGLGQNHCSCPVGAPVLRRSRPAEALMWCVGTEASGAFFRAVVSLVNGSAYLLQENVPSLCSPDRAGQSVRCTPDGPAIEWAHTRTSFLTLYLHWAGAGELVRRAPAPLSTAVSRGCLLPAGAVHMAVATIVPLRWARTADASGRSADPSRSAPPQAPLVCIPFSNHSSLLAGAVAQALRGRDKRGLGLFPWTSGEDLEKCGAHGILAMSGRRAM